MSDNIIQLIETELKTIATAKEKLREYRRQLGELYGKLDAELTEGVSAKKSVSGEQPTKEEVLGALTKEALTMGQLVKSFSGRFSAGQLRKVLAELAASGKVKRTGEKRATTYTLKK